MAAEAQGAIGQRRISERVQAVEAAGGWRESPFFSLHAVPDPPWSRPDDFYSDQGLKGRLAEPRVLRRDGFHIWSGAAPELLADGSISCATDRRIVWLSDDGYFTAAARGDEEFLGWYYNQRRPADAPMVVNPRVLAEYVFEFCRFAHSELKPRAAGTWTLFLSTVGFDRSGGHLLAPALGRGGNGLYFPGMARNEHRPLRPNDQRSVLSGASAGDDAYRILVEFYALFGAPPDEIPYARGREISAESILGQ